MKILKVKNLSRIFNFNIQKFAVALCLASCFIMLGAASPMIGDDDPEAVLEVWRTKECNSYSGGIAGFFKKVITGKWKDINFDYCPCIPLDLGEAASLQGVLNALWSFVKSIPSGFWSGKFDIGIRTKSPQLEKTQKELWQKMWIEDGGSRELNVEAEAMLKNITISYSQALLNAYNASLNELKKVGYTNNQRSNPSALEPFAWMPDRTYTGFTNMNAELDSLNQKWRQLHNGHLKAMKALAGNYSSVKNAMNTLYTEMLKDDDGKTAFAGLTNLYQKVMDVVDKFNNLTNQKMSWDNIFSIIGDAVKLAGAVKDVIEALNKDLLGDAGFNKRMLIFQMLMALKDDVALSLQVWKAALLDKNPLYPLNTVKESFKPVLNDLLTLLFMLPNEKGQTKMLQLAIAMAQQQGGLHQLNEYSVSLFQDVRSWTRQADNAKKQAIRTNMVTVGSSAAKKPSGTEKSFKLGF